MPKKLSHQQAKEKLESNNSLVIFLDEYTGSSKTNKFKCLVCFNSWSVKPKDVISGRSGCPECGRLKSKNTPKYKLNTDDFIQKVNKLYPNKINVISEYISANDRIIVECNHCKNIWKPEAKRLISGESSCKKCSEKNIGIKIRKKHEQFLSQIYEIYGDRISILSRYTTCLNRIDVFCNICNHHWSPISRSLLRRSCPKCNFSKGELIISSILSKIGVKFEEQFVFTGLKTENNGTPKFDFVIFENDAITKVIEYDGFQHFKPVKKWGGEKRLRQQIMIDEFKNEFCRSNSIKMIRIPYTDYDRINIKYINDLLNDVTKTD